MNHNKLENNKNNKNNIQYYIDKQWIEERIQYNDENNDNEDNNSNEYCKNNIDINCQSFNTQYQEIKNEEDILNNFNIVSKKYQQYQNNQSNQTNRNTNNLYNEIINSKEVIINDLKIDINNLNQKLINLTFLYNDKIEQLRIEQKKELYLLHAEYIKKIRGHKS